MKQVNLLEDPVNKLFARYLLPSISATMVTSIYILADTLMIGRGVGAIGIAALNILLPLFSLFFATGMLFGAGGGILLSVSKGKMNDLAANQYYTSAFLMTVVMSAVYTVLGQVFFTPVTRFLGSNETMAPYVEEYGRILISGAPAFLFSSFYQVFVRNDKAPKIAMTAVVSGGVFNIILDYILIFSMKMGMAGAAAATVTGSALTLVILLTHLVSKENTLRFVAGAQIGQAAEVVKNGISSFLLDMCNGVVTFLFNRQILSIAGELGVVVYGIISNSSYIASSVNNGISQAVQPILATNFGAGKKERLTKVRQLAERTALISGAVFAVTGLLVPALVTEAFVKPDPEILAMAVPAVRIYFLSFAAMGMNVLYTTWFQSVMKPAAALKICLLRGIVLNSFLVFLFPVFMGITGVWAVMPVTEALTLVVCRIMLKKQDS
ncbi:MATE family efflux transporter [Lacrimispora sp.]|jgi:putative MATE family efflux protein|uniref:MATE family efflux transporter n=1 Tax=Lacrimispora sp. TaxID=2719234 RepID=UPI0029E7104F|nr:hypothetical protein [Lacrimispora sp.]